MSRVPDKSENRNVETGPVYVCAFCKTRFHLPASVPVSIRYVGRTPEVECLECVSRRVDDSLAFPQNV